MTKLYSELAHIYHEMYQKLFDYKKEFDYYSEILSKYSCKSVLEIGCGTGQLAKYLIEAGYDYLGVDLYEKMLKIAREENLANRFVQGDMRYLQIDQHFDSVIITGRTFAYLNNNSEINSTLEGIHEVLNPHGKLIFDSFDAESIFSDFVEYSEQKIELKDKVISRINKSRVNLKTGWTWDWQATYIIQEKDEKKEYEDLTTLRAFTKDEIALFLMLNNFQIITILDDKSVIKIISEKV